MRKTYGGILKKVCHVLGNGTIINHPPTERNPLGQSGLHTFIDDIMDIVDECGLHGVWDIPTQRRIAVELSRYLQGIE